MFLLLVLEALIFLSAGNCFFWTDIKTCVPSHHYWQPFYNCIPPKAYLAGVDRNGDKKYIARIISADKRSWSATTTFTEKNLYVFFSWDKEGEKVDKHIEILCVNRPSPGFGWRDVGSHDLDPIKKACCLVEGGSGYKDGKKIVSYVGRTLKRGQYYIGGVYEWTFFEYPMRYTDEIGGSYGTSDFDVLAYDCCTKEYCKKPNRADCCYDM